MTKREKIKEKFLNNPVSLKLSEIESFLKAEGFELIEAKGSHKKVRHKKSGKMYILPIHNSDVLNVYKKKLLEFYNNILILIITICLKKIIFLEQRDIFS